MNPAVIIEHAAIDGVVLSLSEKGNINVTGKPTRIGKWAPIIREHRVDLIALLSGSAGDEVGGRNASFCWRIGFEGRDPVLVTISPMAIECEVRTLYPNAVLLESVQLRPGRPATQQEATELRQLVAGIYRDDTEADQIEALVAALADPESALTCYRNIAAERNWIRSGGREDEP